MFWVIFPIAGIGLAIGTAIGVFILFAVQVSAMLILVGFFAMVNLQIRGTVTDLYDSYPSCVESVCPVGKFLQLKRFVDVRL